MNKKILNGVNQLADTVKVTLGAKGKTVMFRSPKTTRTLITKDGVTVAKEVRAEDETEQMAIEIVREASERTVKSSGDGTTTTLVLAQYLINKGAELLERGEISYYELSNQLEAAKEKVIKLIEEHSISIEDDFDKLFDVASVSSNSRDIGDYIYKIMKEIGLYGHIEVKASKASKTRVEQVNGIRYNRGYYAPQFLNDFKKMEWRVTDAYIVMVDDTIRTMNDIYPYIYEVNRGREEHNKDQLVHNHPILFIVNEVEPTILNTLINNKTMNQNMMNIMITEHDGFGDRKMEIMNDIAALTGCIPGDFTDNPGMIGRATEIIVDEDYTSIIGGSADEQTVNELIAITQQRLEDPNLSDNDRVYYKRRLATLAGGVAVIHVGAPTEVEMREKKDRIDDAVEAVKAAIDRGVTIGGGYTFLQIALTLTTLDTTMGATLLSGALQAPFLQLCKNASIPEAVANEYSKKISLSDSNLGLDVIDNMLKPLTEYNVYDPAGVLIDSLSNAISVAKNILSIEAVIEPINYSKALGGAESAFPPGYPL